jgi:uncharacterized membrane protein
MSDISWWWNVTGLVPEQHNAWMLLLTANGPNAGPWGMHMMWDSWGIGMMLMMIVFWAAIIVAIVFLIRWLITAGSPGQDVAGAGSENALDILQNAIHPGRSASKNLTRFNAISSSDAGCADACLERASTDACGGTPTKPTDIRSSLAD